MQGVWACVLEHHGGPQRRGVRHPGVRPQRGHRRHRGAGRPVPQHPAGAGATGARRSLWDQLPAMQQRHIELLEHDGLDLAEIQRLAGAATLFDTLLVVENYPDNTYLERQLSGSDDPAAARRRHPQPRLQPLSAGAAGAAGRVADAAGQYRGAVAGRRRWRAASSSCCAPWSNSRRCRCRATRCCTGARPRCWPGQRHRRALAPTTLLKARWRRRRLHAGGAGVTRRASVSATPQVRRQVRPGPRN